MLKVETSQAKTLERERHRDEAVLVLKAKISLFFLSLFCGLHLRLSRKISSIRPFDGIIFALSKHTWSGRTLLPSMLIGEDVQFIMRNQICSNELLALQKFEEEMLRSMAQSQRPWCTYQPEHVQHMLI